MGNLPKGHCPPTARPRYLLYLDGAPGHSTYTAPRYLRYLGREDHGELGITSYATDGVDPTPEEAGSLASPIIHIIGLTAGDCLVLY